MSGTRVRVKLKTALPYELVEARTRHLDPRGVVRELVHRPGGYQTLWWVDLAASVVAGDALKEAATRLQEIGGPLRLAIIELQGEAEGWASVSIYQEISEDVRTYGFDVPASLIGWAASIGARLEVYQELDLEESPTPDSGEPRAS